MQERHSIVMGSSYNIYLSSEDSRTSFPGNSSSDFLCLLPERLRTDDGDWFCALLELQLPQIPENPVYACCNLCVDSIAGEYQLPVLTRISDKVTRPSHVTYVPVKTCEVETIHLYFYDSIGRAVSFTRGTSYCTLRICNYEGLRYNP